MKFLLSIFLALFFGSAIAMQAELIENNYFRLSGEIRKGDYDRLIAFFKEHPREFVLVQWVELDSPGGNVAEALKLAQFIRDTSRTTSIKDGSKCVSACFFLFVAGGARLLYDGGKLGIHRPYYNPAEFKSLSTTKAREAYERLDTEVRAFLSSMRVPDVVVNQMFATPSSSIKFLSPSEFESQIGLQQPWYEEFEHSVCPGLELSCIKTKAMLDRLTMLKTYLGEKVAQEQFAWMSNAQRNLLSQMDKFSKVPPPEIRSTTPKLDAAHPGWKEIVRNKSFGAWMNTQSQQVKDLAKSTNEDDAIHMLDLYKARQTETTDILHLSCDLTWAGSSNPFHLDIPIDIKARKSGKAEAEITDEYFVLTSNTATTRINRRSGAISIYTEKLSAQGTCSRSVGTKF